ncbi:MAG: hypothetical protein P8L85_06745 [Rubripirellula sp.]|nr:hypothetical protein [Planctomycetaceae bacterium]MDG2221058.1 hypothetical protein [Rubripirellula sp.]
MREAISWIEGDHTGFEVIDAHVAESLAGNISRQEMVRQRALRKQRGKRKQSA